MTFNIKTKQPKEKDSYEVETKKGYNGWANFHTWQVALNIDNDEGTYKESRRAIQYGQIKSGEDYKNWFKEMFPSKEEGFYKIYDGWSESELDDVDWDEIYESHKSEIKEEEDEEE